MKRALIVGVLLLAVACGPEQSVQLGVQGFASSVVLGRTKARAATPPLASPPEAQFPVLAGTPPFFLPPFPAYKPQVCSPPPAGTSPMDSAPATVTEPPAPGYYVFRQRGSRQDAGGPAIQAGGTSGRLVAKINWVSRSPNVDFTYAVAAPAFGEVTVTTYEVVDQAADPGGAQNGIYLNQLQTFAPGSLVPDTLTFSPHLRVLPFPAVPGARVVGAAANSAAATDSAHHVEYDVSGIVSREVGVDLCDSAHDAWEVVLTGHLVTPGASLNLTMTWDFATQLGGLIIYDHSSYSPTSGADLQTTQDLESTLNYVQPVQLGGG